MKTTLTPDALEALTRRTLGHYDANAHSFRDATWGHDVSQNYDALLGPLMTGATPKLRLLDFGCGPGRDLVYFRSLGHETVGLDGSAEFVAMARAAAHCEVLHQSFLALDLPAGHFDGVFANASLQHVPQQELPRVLRELNACLRDGGVLFTSIPYGQNDSEGYHGDRYSVFLSPETWRSCLSQAGFAEIEHFYRPTGKPREQQPWLATSSRKLPLDREPPRAVVAR